MQWYSVVRHFSELLLKADNHNSGLSQSLKECIMTSPKKKPPGEKPGGFWLRQGLFVEQLAEEILDLLDQILEEIDDLLEEVAVVRFADPAHG